MREIHRLALKHIPTLLETIMAGHAVMSTNSPKAQAQTFPPPSPQTPQSNPTQLLDTLVDWRETVTEYLKPQSFGTLNSNLLFSPVALTTRSKCLVRSRLARLLPRERRSSYHDSTRGE